MLRLDPFERNHRSLRGSVDSRREIYDSGDPLRVFNPADDCEHVYRYVIKRLKDDKSDKYG